ncbi:MAG: hypothetical protein GPJ52_04230 [Candidatus Heimdallarchaeota archaeon]|nr:hypothetical protein [Candidatus Heimdallarchaeota archaeon]
MVVISWQNDPFLLDPKPAAMNEWLTANKIIATGKQAISSIVNDQTHKMNLFPILVRRIDFIREKESDRILSRFPYLVLTDEEKELINTKILLIAEIARDYFYQSITSGIMDWKRRLDTYLERGALPYPLYRCASEILHLSLVKQGNKSILFESARGKRYSIPTILSPKLTYLCGVINGDGHLHQHWLRVIDETKEHIELLSELFAELFSDSGEIFQTGNAWNVELRSSMAVRLFNFLTDQTIQGAKYASLREPLLIKQLGEPFRQLYWRGAMDADGSFKHHISFGSASKTYVNDFNTYLHSVGIKSKTGTIGDYAFSLTIPALFRLKFIKHIGVDNPKKKADMHQLFKNIQGQFNGLNQSNLINGLYFNLLTVKGIIIHGFQDYLVSLRGLQSRKERSKDLTINPQQYSAYERGVRGIPLTTIQFILDKEDKELMELLISLQSSLRYKVSTSTQIKLPIRITSEIIELFSLILPLKNYAKILTKSEKDLAKFQKVFGLDISDNRLNSRLVVKFLSTFGIYRKPKLSELSYQPISDEFY